MEYKTQNNVFSNIPKRIKGLAEIAENLWWVWNPQARMLFKMLDRQAWKESGHNPDQLLKTLSKEYFEKVVQDANYLRHYDLVMSQFRKYVQIYSDDLYYCRYKQPIAYFSAEYGLHRSLPFYAGGLGFLAGDHLKECSDQGIPIVAVGFMYPSGYLHQVIDHLGWQENYTQHVDREAAAINRLVDQENKQIVFKISEISIPIHVSIWKVDVGRVNLFLLDTALEENDLWIRDISERLYTSDPEQRLLQEIILGIGGAKALKRLGIDYSMLHLNEGHAGFVFLEEIKEEIKKGNKFEEAAKLVQKKSLFTTHTPVPAGHDVFSYELIEKYFSSYWPELGLEKDSFLRLGRHPEDPDKGFNMTAMAMRLSGFRNTVSKKHCQVSKKMWHCLWPELKQEEVPIDYVTNGVHLPTWLEPKMRLLFNYYFGEDWVGEHDNPTIWEFVEEIPDRELWQMHYWLKMKLINFIRFKAREKWSSSPVDPFMMIAHGTLLDPAVLTIGFARRFASYKRADLIFSDLERLKRIIKHNWRPIQIIFAGKSHPADDNGKAMIQRIFQLIRDPELKGRVAFVENYNEQLAQYLVHGVDIWLNNPIPPLEASGTSGMKAALNGVPHLSIPDGWWLEGYNGENGWIFGSEKESKEDRNKNDAEELYQLLKNQIIPMYYQTDEDGTPHQWLRYVKNSIKSNAPQFSAKRMVKEYVQKFYCNCMENLEDIEDL